MGTSAEQNKIDICKRCKKPFEVHVVNLIFYKPYWCFSETQIIEPIQAGWSFIPMDNLDYVEWVAKQKNLV